ncbi:MAG: disulfide bond formation protein B [Nitratireductor sp.]
MNLNAQTSSFQIKMAALSFLGMSAVIAAVLIFQHGFGYIPCKLCLGQREPYYVAIPLAFIALISAWQKWPACLTRGFLALCAILMVYAAVLGIQHAGVEWAWWEGPTDCGAVAGGEIKSTGDLLSQLATQKPPSCNEAAGRFLGLSFAGWNVVVSIILALIAFKGAFQKASD